MKIRTGIDRGIHQHLLDQHRIQLSKVTCISSASGLHQVLYILHGRPTLAWSMDGRPSFVNMSPEEGKSRLCRPADDHVLDGKADVSRATKRGV